MSKALGIVLREARVALNKTQGEIAKEIGVSRAAVGQWEKGDDPSTDNLIAVCRHLGIDLQSAIGGVLRKYPSDGYPNSYDRDHIFDTDPSILHPVEKIINLEEKEEAGKIAHVVSMAHATDSEMLLIGIKPLFYVPVAFINDNENRFYALGLETNHAEPAVPRGEYALVDSKTPPSIGDYVVVMLRSTDPIVEREHIIDGLPRKGIPMLPGYVGKFVDHTAQAIVLSQPFPETKIQIKLSHISWMHRIVPIPDGKIEVLYARK